MDIMHETYFAYNCPQCGRYILPQSTIMRLHDEIDEVKNKISIFLFHNKVEDKNIFIGTSDVFFEYKKKNPTTEAILYTLEEIEIFFPKNFDEKINKILCALFSRTKYEGDFICLNDVNKCALFFCDAPDDESREKQFNFIIEYLKSNNYVNCSGDYIQLLPEGYKIVYDLQNNKTDLNKVFVAMKFGNDTLKIREAIREGVLKTGYSAIYIDEKIHNHQIVPTMLNEIKECKFLIMDCSHPNYGAYYEAGIALGLGKEVIITCSRKSFDENEKPHFDIAQKQILIWNDEIDLTNKLIQWIKAVIK